MTRMMPLEKVQKKKMKGKNEEKICKKGNKTRVGEKGMVAAAAHSEVPG